MPESVYKNHLSKVDTPANLVIVWQDWTSVGVQEFSSAIYIKVMRVLCEY